MPRVHLSPTRDVVLPEDYLAVKRMHDTRRVAMTQLERDQIESEKQRKESEFPLLNFVEFRPPLYVTSGGNYRSGIPEWRREVPWRQPADQSLDDIVQGGKSSVEDRTGRLPDDTLQRTLQGRLGDSYEPGPEDEYVSPTKDKVGRENGPLRVSPAKVSTLHQMQRLGRAKISEESKQPPSLFKPGASPPPTHRSNRSELDVMTSSFVGWHNEDTWGGMQAPPYQSAAQDSPKSTPKSTPKYTPKSSPTVDKASERPASDRQSDHSGEAPTDWQVREPDPGTPLPASILDQEDDRLNIQLTNTSQLAAGPPDPTAARRNLDSSTSSTSVYYASLYPRSPGVPVDQSMGSAYGVAEATPWKALPSPVLRGSEAPSALLTPDSVRHSRSPEAMYRSLAQNRARLAQQAEIEAPAVQLAQQAAADVSPTYAVPPAATPPSYGLPATTIDTPLASTLFGYAGGSPGTVYHRPGTGIAAPPAAFSLHRSGEEQEVEDFVHALQLPAALPDAQGLPEQSEQAPPIQPLARPESRDVFWKKIAV